MKKGMCSVVDVGWWMMILLLWNFSIFYLVYGKLDNEWGWCGEGNF